MKLVVSSLISVILLTGCVSNPPIIKREVITVEVPVPVPCTIRGVEKPVTTLDNLTPEDDIHSMTAKALAEIERRIAYEKELEAAVKECQ